MTLRDDYNRDGYVILPNELPPQKSPNKNWFLREFKKGVENYINFLSMVPKTITMQDNINRTCRYRLPELGLTHPKMVSTPIIHVMSPFLRIPDGYYGTGAHQDWASTQGSLDCVTVWIALTDITLNDFPLEVIPGSHLGGLREGKMNGSVLEVEADDKEFVPIECKVGDVIFLSGFTVHRTGKGNGFRVAVSQRFDNASEPTFIERGYPCTQKRVVERDIKWKPTVEQVQGIFK